MLQIIMRQSDIIEVEGKESYARVQPHHADYETNLVYLLLCFEIILNGSSCFSVFRNVPRVLSIRCVFPPETVFMLEKVTTTSHVQISYAKHTGKKKIVPDPCRWMVCILNVMFCHPYHCPSLKIFMRGHKISYPFSNIQYAACMLLASSGRHCPA